MDRRPGFRLQSHRLRAIVAHGVVSTGAQRPASFGFQSPGDYATCNSNHTPDGTNLAWLPYSRLELTDNVEDRATLVHGDRASSPNPLGNCLRPASGQFGEPGA